MKTAILLHGTPPKEEYYNPSVPSPSNAHWFPWLTKELQIRDIHAICPEMPFSFEPRYDVWKKEFERFDIDEHTILVGHSCGAGFLLRWLSENSHIKTRKIILVAPWLDPFGEIEEKDFFDFTFDTNILLNRNI